MIQSFQLFPKTLQIDFLKIEDTVLITWLVMGLLFIFSLWLKNRLSLYRPGVFQLILEALIEGAERLCKEVIKGRDHGVLFFLLTLWIFIGTCNLIGIVPGFFPPTSDLNTPLAFAFSAFLMRHLLGIKLKGAKTYLKHFFKPFFFLFPLHLLSELTRSFALAIRLFGNILSGEIIALILLGIAGFFLPVPFIILHLLLGLLQAYLFGILSLAFLSQAFEENTHLEEEE